MKTVVRVTRHILKIFPLQMVTCFIIETTVPICEKNMSYFHVFSYVILNA